jgi:hypothetical protein
MPRPRILLVPNFTELEWGIAPQLEEWAEVASYDSPGVGAEPFPEALEGFRRSSPAEERDALVSWRAAVAERGLAEVERRGWERFFVVADSFGPASVVGLAQRAGDAVEGIALGHAAVSHDRGGDRPAISGDVWDAMTSLMRTDSEAFVRYGLTQMTRGGYDEELAERMIARFPDMEVVAAFWEALGSHPEPIGEELAALDVPLLLAEHADCLIHTREGYEDIVAAFPAARTVSCPEACCASPAFAEALREFCEAVLARG